MGQIAIAIRLLEQRARLAARGHARDVCAAAELGLVRHRLGHRDAAAEAADAACARDPERLACPRTVQYITLNYITLQHITLHTIHEIQSGFLAHVQYVTVHYITLQYITIHYSTVQYSTVQYSTVQYSTVQYSTVQYSTVQYSTVQYSKLRYSTVKYITGQ